MDEVWLLWESYSSVDGHKNLMGIYSNEKAAEADAAKSPKWSVQKWAVDHEEVA